MVVKFYVYILSNEGGTLLYVGMTNNLKRRVEEHREKLNRGFTYDYNVNRLVYFEQFYQPKKAIHREKCIKRWKRSWKEELIATTNPSWEDLFSQL